jgi:hypothetical protein
MKELLEKITSDAQIEARWLNTVSLLEFIGSRKISRTVAAKHPSPEILSHYADEVRHARVFKDLSILKAGRDLGDEMLGREVALDYFQTLDRTISGRITEICGAPDQYANYIFVTLAIERRAMKLYPLYRSITSDAKVREALTSILQEESGHLEAIEKEAVDFVQKKELASIDEILASEENLFSAFCAALGRGIQ